MRELFIEILDTLLLELRKVDLFPSDDWAFVFNRARSMIEETASLFKAEREFQEEFFNRLLQSSTHSIYTKRAGIRKPLWGFLNGAFYGAETAYLMARFPSGRLQPIIDRASYSLRLLRNA